MAEIGRGPESPVLEIFEKGKQFTEELLKENENLRKVIARLKTEKLDLENQYVKAEVPHLRQKVELLESVVDAGTVEPVRDGLQRDGSSRTVGGSYKPQEAPPGLSDAIELCRKRLRYSDRQLACMGGLSETAILGWALANPERRLDGAHCQISATQVVGL